jgi:hemolysin activation/secretion protein
VNIAHQPRESISYALEAGRETQLGTTSDLVQDWYVRPNVTWKVINGLDINTSFFYEHGNEGVGSENVPGNSSGNETFDWYGGELSVQHPLTSRFTLGLDYRLTFRSSSSPDDGYTQNLVGLQLTYHPK